VQPLRGSDLHLGVGNRPANDLADSIGACTRTATKLVKQSLDKAARSLDLPPEQSTEWIELLVKILRAIVSEIEGGRSSRQRRRMACQSTPVIPAGSPCSAGARLHSERTVPPLMRSREIGGYRARFR
jgi:hypothetical protein